LAVVHANGLTAVHSDTRGHILTHINIHVPAVKRHGFGRGDADIAAAGIQMDFIATLVGDDNTFIFCEDNTVAASCLDGFNAVVASPTQRGSSMEHPAHHEGTVRMVVQTLN